MEPNSHEFTIGRWDYAGGTAPVWTVTWEDTYMDDDDDDGEKTREFSTLDEAIAFGRALVEAVDRLSKEDA